MPLRHCLEQLESPEYRGISAAKRFLALLTSGVKAEL
ncbi:hypothetical protein F443_18200 [Phytophthora nicotianae P1569]|uniref:Uncharacterized protein n=1 Tax=Phytophthora nicotianae P1569 TaxID=1317065 RepID=V9E912_PHYNI|nr:hypothetical protein F443_18200 [Phytophthora nicotianae P1569]